MKLKLFRHLWGVNGAWEEVFPKIKADGYDGLDTRIPEGADAGRFSALLKEHGFEYIAATHVLGKTVDEQVESFRRQVETGAKMGAVLINCHSGLDAWSMEESEAFYRQAVAIEKSVGIGVAHETHRGRVFYNPWTTVALLRKFETLKLCCDYSHWVCVAERLIEDDEIFRFTAQRALHVHARVGYEEGPQVPDPSAPEYQQHLEAHERWWDMIWDAQEATGMAVSTLTPEFGPPGYMHTLPHTNVPVADLWSVCNWQAKRQRERFEGRGR